MHRRLPSPERRLKAAVGVARRYVDQEGGGNDPGGVPQAPRGAPLPPPAAVALACCYCRCPLPLLLPNAAGSYFLLPVACAHLIARSAAATFAANKQGVQDTVLEAELPDVAVNDRALAINSLLAGLKLQVPKWGLLLLWSEEKSAHRGQQRSQRQQEAWLARPLQQSWLWLWSRAPHRHCPADPGEPCRPQQPHLQGQHHGGCHAVSACQVALGFAAACSAPASCTAALGCCPLRTGQRC